jgi:hypothetical protein
MSRPSNEFKAISTSPVAAQLSRFDEQVQGLFSNKLDGYVPLRVREPAFEEIGG